MILLSEDYDKAMATVANLPTNEDTLSAMVDENNNEKQKEDISPNRLSVVIWADQKGKYSWYLGYLSRSSTDNLIVDHLSRETSNSHKIWKYPAKSDVHEVDPVQVLKVEPLGEWQFESRVNKYILRN